MRTPRATAWTLARRGTTAVLACPPLSAVSRRVAEIPEAHARRLRPESGLRVLLDLDGRTYVAEGRMAGAYGRGTHPKERLTDYHAFFVERIGATARVLYVGCGTGAPTHDIAASTGASAVGIDTDPRALATARAENALPTIEYVLADVMQVESHAAELDDAGLPITESVNRWGGIWLEARRDGGIDG